MEAERLVADFEAACKGAVQARDLSEEAAKAESDAAILRTELVGHVLASKATIEPALVKLEESKITWRRLCAACAAVEAKGKRVCEPAVRAAWRPEGTEPDMRTLQQLVKAWKQALVEKPNKRRGTGLRAFF